MTLRRFGEPGQTRNMRKLVRLSQIFVASMIAFLAVALLLAHAVTSAEAEIMLDAQTPSLTTSSDL
jgi:hypothetical protein